MTEVRMNLREALEAEMANIDEGIARSRRPDREGFLVFSRIRELLAAYPDEVTYTEEEIDEMAAAMSARQWADAERFKLVKAHPPGRCGNPDCGGDW